MRGPEPAIDRRVRRAYMSGPARDTPVVTGVPGTGTG